MTSKHRSISYPLAFTLIELLVVISIIALLIAILLPALSSARTTVRNVQCLSALRQNAIANQLYAADSKGFVAYNYRQDGGTQRHWFNVLAHLYLHAESSGSGLSSSQDRNVIWGCPEWRFGDDTNAGDEPGYGMNWRMKMVTWDATGRGRDADGTSPDSTWHINNAGEASNPIRLDDIRRTSDRALFGDSTSRFLQPDFDNSYRTWRPDLSRPRAPWRDSHPDRHGQHANYVMFDGHAESLPPDDALLTVRVPR